MLLTGKYFVAWIEHGRQTVKLGHHAVQAKLHTGLDAGNACPAEPNDAETVVGLPDSTCIDGVMWSGTQGVDDNSGKEWLIAGRLMRHRLDEAGAHRPPPGRKITDSLRPGTLAGCSSSARSVSQSG